MSEPQNIDLSGVTADTRAGRMLLAGRLTATVTSPRTGDHITIQFVGKQKTDAGGWKNVPLCSASHVFVKVPNPDGFGDKVGTIYPKNGTFYADNNADPARVFAMREVVAHVTEQAHRCEVVEESRCGKCGRELTDPISIERGVGPECYGSHTGSKHQSKTKKNITQEQHEHLVRTMHAKTGNWETALDEAIALEEAC